MFGIVCRWIEGCYFSLIIICFVVDMVWISGSGGIVIIEFL